MDDESKPQGKPQDQPQDQPENQPHQHNLVYHSTVEPSCQQEGYTYYSCTGCDYGEGVTEIYEANFNVSGWETMDMFDINYWDADITHSGDDVTEIYIPAMITNIPPICLCGLDST